MMKELVKLQSFVTTAYNLDEFRTLCIEMSVDFDELGEGGKSIKVQAFLIMIGKQGRYDELLNILKNERSSLFLQTDLSLDQKFQKKLYASLNDFARATNQRQPRPRDEQILLQRVKKFWVEGVLENSLFKSTFIKIDKEYNSVAVDYPWESELQPTSLQVRNQAIDEDKHIDDIFDEVGKSLLILGQPGSGKTTLLLELAKQLIIRAERDTSLPIPVVLHLSSWTGNKSIFSWIIEELKVKYRIPKTICRRWLNKEKLILLLDGLDEVKSDRRAKCIEAINSFIIDHGLTQLAVCSRVNDYEGIEHRLRLQDSIILKPLSNTEIDEYLSAGGDSLSSVRSLVKNDEASQELAKTPLFLNIMALTFQDQQTDTFLGSGVEERQQQLFEAYIHNMLTRRGKVQDYSLQQILDYLRWLANMMNGRSQTIFSVENLQPSWLSTKMKVWVYVIVTRILCGFLIGIALWLVSTLKDYKLVLIEGLIAGLVIGIIDGFRFEREHDKSESSLITGHGFIKIFFFTVLRVILIGISVGSIVGIISGLIGDVISGIADALLYGLIFGLVFGLRGGTRTLFNDINTVELLVWSWKTAIIGFFRGWIISLFVGFVMGFIVSFLAGAIVGIGSLNFTEFVSGLIEVGFNVGFVISLIIGFVGGLIGFFVGGLRAQVVEVKSRPNEGIYLSLRNAILSGTVIGFGFGISFLIFGWVIANLLGYFNLTRGPGDWSFDTILPIGLWIWLLTGLIVTFLYGGFDIVQHTVLRLILSRHRHLPMKLTVFLDAMVDRIILRRVGGSYIFIHRMVMEYLASRHPSFLDEE